MLPTSTGTSTIGTDTSTATATGTPAPPSSSGGGGVSTGAIVGAAVGGLAGTLAIGALLFYLCRGKKPEEDATRATSPSPSQGMMGPDGRPIVEMGVDGEVVRGPVAGHVELMADVQRPVEIPGDFGNMKN